jgi:gluconolactonase
VLEPEGKLIGRIEFPEKPANCAFGGDDNRTLYVTARTSLYSVPMKVAGIPLREVEELLSAAPADGQQDESSKADEKVETVTVKARDITLEIPKAWKSSPPSSNMRLAQFEIPAVEGDEEPADLVIFPPFGGGVSQNVQRWIGQFSSQGRQLKLTQGEAEQGKYVVVDITGTYNKPDGPPIQGRTIPTPGYRMLAVLFSKTGGGDYSFKLTGPEKTVGEATDLFRASFGGDAEKEKPYEF